jgi:hypothetical protein
MSGQGSEFIANRFIQQNSEKTGKYVLPKDRVPEQKSFDANFPDLGTVKTTHVQNNKPKMAWNKILTQTVQTEIVVAEPEAIYLGKKQCRVVEMPHDEEEDSVKLYLPNLSNYVKKQEDKRQNERYKYDNLFGPPTPEESEEENDLYDDFEDDDFDDTDEETELNSEED